MKDTENLLSGFPVTLIVGRVVTVGKVDQTVVPVACDFSFTETKVDFITTL